ncbi:MAG: 2OG-Fe(II) oxygenase [Cytophagales bacterium]|nr:2OG-Fe(II) oxygenase [Cytophagales bacterium]
MPIQYTFGLPVKNDYADYVILENVFAPQEVAAIRELWNPVGASAAHLAGSASGPYDQQLRNSSINFINPHDSVNWIFERLARCAIEENNRRFLFEILGLNEGLQLARYDKNDQFNWHMDFGAGPVSQRKLSMSVQLSEPNEYEGGDLQFMINDQAHNAPRTPGTMIIFPSYVMHRVTPITSGTRMSLVGWVNGMPFR